jgi:hypothetical protein
MLAMKRSCLKLGAMLMFSLLSAVCGGRKGTISVVNEAEEPISRATVHVSGQALEIVNLRPSETVSGSYPVTKDSHYTIEVVFLSGKRLTRETGYITSRSDVDDRIVIAGSAIEFQPRHR